VAAAGALVAAPALAQAVTRLKIQTAVPSSSIYFDLMKRMADRVDKMSNGRLKMEMLPDGAVVAAFEIVDAVDKGVVDGGYAWTHYWSGKNTAAGLFSNPAAGGGTGMDQLSHVAWLYQGGGYALFKKFYADVLKLNIEPLMVQPMGPDPLGWFKAPINSLDDMRKLKYRSPQANVSPAYRVKYRLLKKPLCSRARAPVAANAIRQGWGFSYPGDSQGHRGRGRPHPRSVLSCPRRSREE